MIMGQGGICGQEQQRQQGQNSVFHRITWAFPRERRKPDSFAVFFGFDYILQQLKKQVGRTADDRRWREIACRTVASEPPECYTVHMIFRWKEGVRIMRCKAFFGLVLALIFLAGAAALASEASPLTGEEIRSLTDQLLSLAAGQKALNDPASEEAASEDGYLYQYDFGELYADTKDWTENTRLNAFQLMDSEIEGPRGARIDWEVNQLMEAIPCANPEMNGTYTEAVLYLTGDSKSMFRYARVERDGQRIAAIQYGEANPAAGTWLALTFGISGDGVSFIRGEGMNAFFDAGALEEMYAGLEALTHEFRYARVPRSLKGTDLAEFDESDLDFSALSYRTAEPVIFGDNVEKMMIDNEDGTWLLRVDGDGFSAVFSCDSEGNHAELISYTILSPDLEGPRCVRLGDFFHEDFTRFRSGEGQTDETGTTEVLYGTAGTAPYGLAEYGDGTEMVLRYVTPVLGGNDVELLLRYEDTVLAEITLHTLKEDE